MFTKIYEMARRIKQKILFEQIHQFLDSKYCTGDKNTHREWLLEFVCHTKAKEAKYITFLEIKSFGDFVIEKEASQFFRNQAAKVLRKFLDFCVKKRYITYIPEENLRKPTEDDKMSMMNKIIPRPNRLPDVEMVKKVRKLHNVHRLSFRKISELLTEKMGKKIHLNSVQRWYHTSKV